MRFLSPTLRCCAKATANRMAQASPDVAVRKLNGGISSSAIFMIGQVSPHARLSATSISRATASELACEAGWGTAEDPQAGPDEGPPVYHQRGPLRQGLCPQTMQSRGALGHVAPQFAMCYGTARFSRGDQGARRRSPRGCKVPLHFKGLAPTVRDGAEPAELPQKQAISKETRRGRR